MMIIMNQWISEVLESVLTTIEDSDVKKAMEYSLMAGGKRIRPCLLHAVTLGYGLDEHIADYFAASLEMIHTYSLIHDDLPAMDNDDLRRGRPTCHKQFDEATAILAGDGLLTHAFYVASCAKVNDTIKVNCIKTLAEMAGVNGMVLGQCLDTEENEETTWESLQKIHKYKTGCLLAAPLMMGAYCAQQPEEIVQKWKNIGIMMGLAFQIQDDIFDVTLTQEQFGKSISDEKNNKVTSVTLLGLKQAKEFMKELYSSVKASIQQMPDFDSSEVLRLLESIETRNK